MIRTAAGRPIPPEGARIRPSVGPNSVGKATLTLRPLPASLLLLSAGVGALVLVALLTFTLVPVLLAIGLVTALLIGQHFAFGPASKGWQLLSAGWKRMAVFAADATPFPLVLATAAGATAVGSRSRRSSGARSPGWYHAHTPALAAPLLALAGGLEGCFRAGFGPVRPVV